MSSFYYKFVYLFLVVLGLCCYLDVSLVAKSGGCSSLGCASSSLQGLLCRAWAPGPWASAAAWLGRFSPPALEHRLSSSGTRVELLYGMCDLPGPGIKSISPSLASGFFTTNPPGKPKSLLLNT